MRNYTQKVFESPILSREEERALWEAADHATLIRRYLPYAVAYVDKRYRHTSKSLRDDLHQMAALGLIRAVQKYDHTQGFAFTTYAQWWVASYVRRHKYKNYRVVSLGSAAQTLTGLWAHFRTGANTTAEFVALGIPEPEAALLAAVLCAPESELFEVPNTLPLPGADLEHNEALEHVRACLQWLPDREAQVIERRFLTDPPALHGDLSEELGITRQRVQQLEVKALKKMRRLLATHYPELQNPLALSSETQETPSP